MSLQESSNRDHQHIYDDPEAHVLLQQSSVEVGYLVADSRNEGSQQEGKDEHIYADPTACIVLQQVSTGRERVERKKWDEGLKQHGREGSQKEDRDHLFNHGIKKLALS